MIIDVVTTTVCNKADSSTGFARVLVEVDATKGLPSQIEIVYKNSESKVAGSKFVNVKYDWAPPLCTCCNVFGHSFEKCLKWDRTGEQVKESQKNEEGFT